MVESYHHYDLWDMMSPAYSIWLVQYESKNTRVSLSCKMQKCAASVRFGVAMGLRIAPAHMYKRPVLPVAALLTRARALRVLQVQSPSTTFVVTWLISTLINWWLLWIACVTIQIRMNTFRRQIQVKRCAAGDGGQIACSNGRPHMPAVSRARDIFR